MIAGTFTSDNGQELAYHQYVPNAMCVDYFFAKPYSAWQRGTFDHTHGLGRYNLPKGADLIKLTGLNIQKIEDALNKLPRKCLGFKTPKELMDFALAA